MCNCSRNTSPYQYDALIYRFRDILRDYSLRGYHCTKLTLEEILRIKSNGMSLQNLESLSDRINRLYQAGLFDEQVSVRLKGENQANDNNRAGMLWFCFFEPHLSGQGGIERFFKSWGGEALYNSHEDDPVTGSILSKIGVPCIVKATVPIKSLKDSYFPDTALISAFLQNRGHNILNSVEHEAFSIESIPAENIVEVIEFPSPQFNQLTKCDSWDQKLSTT